MSIFITIYNVIFYQPLFNGLVFLTNIVPFHDIGIAVIALTFIVRVVLFPFTHRSIRTQVKMKELEPQLKKIKEEFKDKKEEQARRTMELYRTHGISPFSGCLMVLLQLPVLIALYRVFFAPIGTEGLYSFVSPPETLHTMFLGFIDMGKRSIVLAALAGMSQYAQVRLAAPKKQKEQTKTPQYGQKTETKTGFQDEFTKALSFQMSYIFPGLIFFLSLGFPAAVTLYWTASNVFAIVHESIVRAKAKRLLSAQRNGNTNPTNQNPHRSPS